ncbi:hypothetical protein FACS1894158_10510 [Betaproteobacteria bacterium]|nr:hypothetical protein FACS1894158_10510 [Betaproteobacteria bacterium]
MVCPEFPLLFIGLLLASNASGVDIKPTVTKAEDFVPEGWKLHSITYGDLNQDGGKDAVLVIQETDEKKIIPNNKNRWNGWKDELNTNPRTLLIAFKNGNTYKLALKNEEILPSQDDADSQYLNDDPLNENRGGGIEITAKNTLVIRFQGFNPESIYRDSYTFRYQNNRFELIGLDIHSQLRENTAKISINYSTGKKLTITENLADNSTKPVKKWSHIKTKPLANLQTLNYFAISRESFLVLQEIQNWQ